MHNIQFHTHGIALYNNKVWKGMNTLHRFTVLLLLSYSLNTCLLCGGCCMVRGGHETTPSIASLLFPVIQLLPILDCLLLPFTCTYTNTGKCKHLHRVTSLVPAWCLLLAYYLFYQLLGYHHQCSTSAIYTSSSNQPVAVWFVSSVVQQSQMQILSLWSVDKSKNKRQPLSPGSCRIRTQSSKGWWRDSRRQNPPYALDKELLRSFLKEKRVVLKNGIEGDGGRRQKRSFRWSSCQHLFGRKPESDIMRCISSSFHSTAASSLSITSIFHNDGHFLRADGGALL